MSLRLLGFLALALLSACTSLGSAYKPPTQGDVAQVKFTAAIEGYNYAVVHMPGARAGCACAAGEYAIIGIFNNRASAVPDSDKYADKGVSTDRFSVAVPANGDEFRFLMTVPDTALVGAAPLPGAVLLMTETRTCQAHYGFVPKPGAGYEIVFRGSARSCQFDIYDVTNGQRAPVSAKRYPMCQLQNEGGKLVSSVERCGG